MPPKVNLVEVGPRDGLQNEKRFVPTAVKIDLIERLAATGLRTVEATSFVSPKWVPQLADHREVMAGLKRRPGVAYPVLVPNLKGFESARAAGALEVAVFASASETFSQKNLNCTVAESLERFALVLAAAATAGVPVRGYVSCVLGCPYEGEIAPAAVADLARRLMAMGCSEISLGDTIGIGTPARTRTMIAAVAEEVPPARLAGHFHNTHGHALANIQASLELGLVTFDSSVAGLGGCPFAQGAAGNVATEDVAAMMQKLGIDTGVDLDALIRVAEFIRAALATP